jgi:hypothetical protein
LGINEPTLLDYGRQYRDFVDVYENGIRVKAVRKDSDEHLEIWKKTPEKLEVPPTDYSEQ